MWTEVWTAAPHDQISPACAASPAAPAPEQRNSAHLDRGYGLERSSQEGASAHVGRFLKPNNMVRNNRQTLRQADVTQHRTIDVSPAAPAQPRSALCHPDRPVLARGLCSRCYGRAGYHQRKEGVRARRAVHRAADAQWLAERRALAADKSPSRT